MTPPSINAALRLLASAVLGCAIALFFSTIALAATSHTQPDSSLKWEPVIEMDGQLFPSYIIATANMPPTQAQQKLAARGFLGDAYGLIGIKITSPSDNAKLSVAVSSKSIMDPSAIECVLPKGGKEYRVFPKIVYRFDSLRKLREPAPATVDISVKIDGHAAGKQAVTVRLRSVNDCVMSAPMECNQKITAVPWMFAAYVDEDYPGIDVLLKEALATKIVGDFSGYQSGKRDDTLFQVLAIWDALQRRGIKYSSITDVSAQNQRVFSQNVRFLDESLKAKQANCVDGSVVIASVLRKIGMDVQLVLGPGHMMVRFYTDQAHIQPPVFLETTLLGVSDLKHNPNPDATRSLLHGREKDVVSFACFKAALGAGADEYAEWESNIRQGKLSRDAVTILDIGDLRKAQVNPISRGEGGARTSHRKTKAAE